MPMSLLEAISPSGPLIRRTVRTALLVGGIGWSLAAGAQSPPASVQTGNPAPATSAPAPGSVPAQPSPGAPESSPATMSPAAPGPGASDPSRAKEGGVRTTTRARQRL